MSVVSRHGGQAGGFAREVVALWNRRRTLGGSTVVLDGVSVIARALVEMAAHRVERQPNCVLADSIAGQLSRPSRWENDTGRSCRQVASI